ncbi:MAG: hypothetical protein NVV70_14810 [Cellulomonas sp.]|uniref:Uncharacterized protein n=1 Tax=Cellulomonas gelida TaxID=1712 RepID=A0A4Y3KNP7_9CELL|nr:MULTISPECIES: hypothetical protein [Cellulomonas]MCR6649341.1 hypothetical protein [Cellulomonas sp.]GEA86041.1 hypothetical protein CGE01nite_32920 [Cellulomonas gelida]GGL19086.1 hypothetical protein GCM10009774_06730 [Cellulomonas gelida]
MRVVLQKVLGGDPPNVVVTAPGLSGDGLWRGDSPPVAGAEVDIELEVPRIIGWTEIMVARDLPRDVRPADGELLLQGIVEDVDQEGVLTLRIADEVVLIETVGEPPLGVVGQHVAMFAQRSELYPTGI